MELRKTHEIISDLLEYAEYLKTNDKLNRWQYDDAYGCYFCQQATNGGVYRPAESHAENCQLVC